MTQRDYASRPKVSCGLGTATCIKTKNDARGGRTPFCLRTVFLGGETAGPPHVQKPRFGGKRFGRGSRLSPGRTSDAPISRTHHTASYALHSSARHRCHVTRGYMTLLRGNSREIVSHPGRVRATKKPDQRRSG